MNMETIGVIGGSALYEIDGLSNAHWKRVSSPFGEPSDDLFFGRLGECQLVFLPRHGRGHRHAPSEINYRANIDVLKRAGVSSIISVSAVGSLREHLKPGMFTLVDQFVDRTHKRESTFFGTGCVAHVSMAHPTCSRLSQHIFKAAKELNFEMLSGSTYLAMEGPQFSTFAESELYRTWNCDVIGMTNMPEAKLAREAEICYITIATITDYDCWHPGHDDVTVAQVIAVMAKNIERARRLVHNSVKVIHSDPNAASCPCRFALEHALVTAPEARSPEILSKLDAVAGRVLNR
jgi:5'-methylthioadenosine phosphorylase